MTDHYSDLRNIEINRVKVNICAKRQTLEFCREVKREEIDDMMMRIMDGEQVDFNDGEAPVSIETFVLNGDFDHHCREPLIRFLGGNAAALETINTIMHTRLLDELISRFMDNDITIVK